VGLTVSRTGGGAAADVRVHDLPDGPQLELGACDDAAFALGSAVATAGDGSSGAGVGENGEGELEAHGRLDLCGSEGKVERRAATVSRSVVQPFYTSRPHQR
jgi:hypothetical protein